MDYYIDVHNTSLGHKMFQLSMEGQNLSDFIKKYLNLCSKVEQRCYGLERHEGE